MSDENRWREQRGLDADTQRLQSRPRLEAELGGEQTADLGVRVERVGLATGAVQREHQLLPRAIAIGMLRDDRPKLADHVGVLAELTRARTSVSASSSRRSSSSCWGSAANGASATSASAAPRHSPSASVASRRASPASPPASACCVGGQRLRAVCVDVLTRHIEQVLRAW
jgi:hypothetical protein